MAKRSTQPRRHRMRQQARRGVGPGVGCVGRPVSVKAFARRYGVDCYDCYTAYADLVAGGCGLAPGDNRWSVRPAPAPKRPAAEPADFDEGWVWIGDHRMFVVGYTSGGAPYGWIDNSIGGAEDRLP
jgi:hypothetical protein